MAVGAALPAGGRRDEEEGHREPDEAELRIDPAPVDLVLPAEREREPEHEQQVREDAAGERAADDVRQAVRNSETRDDQLRRVAEARVQEAADARAGVLGDVLGGLADQPRERDQRGSREDEQRHVAGVEGEVDEEGDRDERERCPEQLSRHARTLAAASWTEPRRGASP